MRAVIFDLDDTLYPRERYVLSGLAAVAGHAASRLALAQEDVFALLCRAHAGSPGRELQALCSRYGLHDGMKAELIEVFRHHRPALWLAHGAEATLLRLRGEGWRLAVLTNGLPAVQAIKVEALKLERLVDHVVYAEEHAPGGKPHGDVFLEVRNRLGMAADRCVMVGDDVACDIGGARKAGLWTLFLDRGGRSDAIVDADARVGSLDEVPAAAALLLHEEVRRAA